METTLLEPKLVYLQSDEQTLSDLAIFTQAGKASIFDIFNKTITQGGGARLSALFKAPLSDVAEIRRRSDLYKFFSQQDYRFPLDSTTMGALAYYMENDDIRTQLQPGGQSLGQKFKNIVAADADHIFVEDGVGAALRTFKEVKAFVKQLQGAVSGTAYERHFRELEKVVENRALSSLETYFNSRPNTAQLADLDKLIRFERRELTLELLSLLYDLDVYIAVGQVARKRGFHFAKALPKDSGVLTYTQVYHPHVEGAIANDLALDRGKNVLFLTGANMAGKSTLMKSLGIALFLAHMGFPVAAKEFEFSVRDGIFTSINLADNLNAGASHYYAEVLRVKEVARELAAGRQLFVIFDEMFRGTNVKDAHDATIAITRAFARKGGSQFIISTHIMEAGELLQAEQLSIQFQYLPTEMKGNVPVYTRVLRNGITADRQGMIIIQNEGILELLDAGIKKR